MGAWGYGPLDNDNAMDWLSTLSASKAMAKDLRKVFKAKKPNPDDVRAAAQMLLVSSENHVLYYTDAEPLVPLAVEALNKILDNDRWMNSWKEQAPVRRNIKSQIKKLEELEP